MLPVDLFLRLVRSRLILMLILIGTASCSERSVSTNNDPAEIPGGERYQLDNGMVIDIAVTGNYDPETEYPLLIINDGEVLFGNMHNLMESLVQNGETEPIIIVGIHSGGQRNNWYIPYHDPWITDNWGPYTPEATKYADAVIQQVLPFVRERYPYAEDKVGILGASLGGLVSTWMGLNYPQHITYSASLSGSFWVADYRLFSEVTQNYTGGQKFWFDIGTGEWNYYVPLYRALDQAGVEPGESNFYYEVPGGQHTIQDWLSRAEMPLKVFFGTTESPSIESMEVVLECIPSSVTAGKKFRRMNPIITLNNGVKYSLAHTATYTLLEGDTELGSEGSLLNNPEIESSILVEYMQRSREVTIPIGWCR